MGKTRELVILFDGKAVSKDSYEHLSAILEKLDSDSDYLKTIALYDIYNKALNSQYQIFKGCEKLLEDFFDKTGKMHEAAIAIVKNSVKILGGDIYFIGGYDDEDDGNDGDDEDEDDIVMGTDKTDIESKIKSEEEDVDQVFVFGEAGYEEQDYEDPLAPTEESSIMGEID